MERVEREVCGSVRVNAASIGICTIRLGRTRSLRRGCSHSSAGGGSQNQKDNVGRSSGRGEGDIIAVRVCDEDLRQTGGREMYEREVWREGSDKAVVDKVLYMQW